MIRSKVLRIIAVTEPLALGSAAYAMIAMKLAPGAYPKRVAQHFRDRPGVKYVLFVGARYDLLVEVICETHEDLRNFLFERCYGERDVASVEPMIGLAIYKNLLKWGQP